VQTMSRLSQTTNRLGQTTSRLSQTTSRLVRMTSRMEQTTSRLSQMTSRLGQTISPLPRTSSRLHQPTSPMLCRFGYGRQLMPRLIPLRQPMQHRRHLLGGAVWVTVAGLLHPACWRFVMPNISAESLQARH
jgi:hypothetical protein